MRTLLRAVKPDATAVNESKPLPPLDRGYALTVLSCDPGQGVCAGCGQRRLIYQAHWFSIPGPSVRARCKPCHETAAAERGGNIFVKTAGGLPKVWEKDRRQEAPAHIKKANAARRQDAK
jgi:hypothetical protein